MSQAEQTFELEAVPVEPYVAGTWGPAGAVRLLDRDGRRWFPPREA